jgi:hypothetical protein
MTPVPASEWRALVGLSPVCLGAGWSGGGILTGPDGRRYPLVVPWLDRDGRRTTTDGPDTAEQGRTGSLGGADPGWRAVGLRVGVEEFGARARGVDKAAVVIAGFAGAAPHAIGRLRPDLLAGLEIGPDGSARLAPGAGAAGGAPAAVSRAAGTAQVPRSALVPAEDGRLRWVPDTSRDPALEGRNGQRATAEAPPLGRSAPPPPNVLALAESGLGGLATARGMDENRTAAYRVLFEENADGRRRARLTLYQVADDGTGPRVSAVDATVGPDGTLRRDVLVAPGG